MRNRFEIPIACAVLGLVQLWCFERSLWSGEFLLADDTLAIQFPYLYSIFVQLRHGTFPAWSPEIALGYPGAASIEVGAFSPFSLPFLVLPPGLAMVAKVVFPYWLTAVSMYLLGRRLGLSKGGAGAAAVFWSSSRSWLFLLHEPRALATAAWFPLLFLAWDRAIAEPRLRRWLAVGLCGGAALLGGHLQLLVGLAGLLVCYAAWVKPRASLRSLLHIRTLGGVGGAAVVALGIAAVTVWPTAVLLAASVRAEGTPVPLTDTTWPALWARLGSVLLPSLGGPGTFELHYEYSEIGLLPLAFALLGLGRGRRVANRLLALAAAFFVLSLGNSVPLVHSLVVHSPLSVFRFPARFGLLAVLATALVAGFGWDAWTGPEPSRGRLLRLLLLAGPALCAGLFLASRTLEPAAWVELACAAAGLSALAAAWLLRRPGRPSTSARVLRWAPIAAFLVSAAAYAGNGGFLSIEEHAAVDLLHGSTSLRDAERRQRGEYPPTALRQTPQHDEHGPTRVMLLTTQARNASLVTGHHAPDSYHALRPARQGRVLYGVFGVTRDMVQEEALRRPELLDLLNVRFVVLGSAEDPATRFGPEWRRSMRASYKDEHYQTLERTGYLPRAYFVNRARRHRVDERALGPASLSGFDPRAEVLLEGEGALPAVTAPARFLPARVTRYENERVEIALEAPSPGWVVLLDRFADGWSCRYNGVAVPIEQANVLFRAVAVEPGPAILVFEFRDASLIRGGVVTLLSLVVVLVALALSFRARSESAAG